MHKRAIAETLGVLFTLHQVIDETVDLLGQLFVYMAPTEVVTRKPVVLHILFPWLFQSIFWSFLLLKKNGQLKTHSVFGAEAAIPVLN